MLYFYADLPGNPGEDKLYRQMLMTFWEQTASKAPSHNTFGESTPSNIIEEELHKLLVSSGRYLYVIIDGLDQLSEASQYQLLEGLNTLVQKLRDENNRRHLSVAISSRDCSGIDQLREHKPFPIEITSERSRLDMATYLETSLRSRLLDKEPRLRQRVLDELIKLADGMLVFQCRFVILS